MGSMSCIILIYEVPSFHTYFAVRSLALVSPRLGLFPFVPMFLSSVFLTSLLHYSCVCFFLLLHPCCSHARGTLCGRGPASLGELNS